MDINNFYDWLIHRQIEVLNVIIFCYQTNSECTAWALARMLYENLYIFHYVVLSNKFRINNEDWYTYFKQDWYLSYPHKYKPWKRVKVTEKEMSDYLEDENNVLATKWLYKKLCKYAHYSYAHLKSHVFYYEFWDENMSFWSKVWDKSEFEDHIKTIIDSFKTIVHYWLIVPLRNQNI